MKAKTYRNLMKVVAILVAAFIAVSIVREFPLYVPVISIVVSLLISNICRRFVKETMTDERSKRIDEKATAVTYRIYTVVTALFVLGVMMVRSRLPSWVGIAGETLAYSLCVLMLVHLFSYSYYARRL